MVSVKEIDQRAYIEKQFVHKKNEVSVAKITRTLHELGTDTCLSNECWVTDRDGLQLIIIFSLHTYVNQIKSKTKINVIDIL